MFIFCTYRVKKFALFGHLFAEYTDLHDPLEDIFVIKTGTLNFAHAPKRTNWYGQLYVRLKLIWPVHRRVQGPKDRRLARDAGISDQDFYLQNLRLPSSDWQHPRL